MSNYDEKQVINKIRQGNISAFQQLVERYKKKVYFLAFDILGRAHEAEDISQEVFIKMYRHREKISDIHKVSTWIHRITVNTCIDELRKKSRKYQVAMEDETMESLNYSLSSDQENNIHNPENDLVVQSQIKHLLNHITARERAVITLRYLKGFKISEISQILEVSQGAIKSLLVRARRKMQNEHINILQNQ